MSSTSGAVVCFYVVHYTAGGEPRGVGIGHPATHSLLCPSCHGTVLKLRLSLIRVLVHIMASTVDIASSFIEGAPPGEVCHCPTPTTSN